MTMILSGKVIADTICEDLLVQTEKLKLLGVVPQLAIVRLGENRSNIAYERGAAKRCAKAGVAVKHVVFSSDMGQEEFLEEIRRLNRDAVIHGILLLRPFPQQIEEEAVRMELSPEKDVDGITDTSLAGIFAGKESVFCPCTAQACLEILDYYGVDVKGKHVTIVGSSLVVGRPVSMMLLKRGATVTLCHIYTSDIPAECLAADIVIAAAGCKKLIGDSHLKQGQIVLDVGINIDEEGKICGDVDVAAALGLVEALTPVPGGIGTITTAVLAKQVIRAAQRVQCIRS